MFHSHSARWFLKVVCSAEAEMFDAELHPRAQLYEMAFQRLMSASPKEFLMEDLAWTGQTP